MKKLVTLGLLGCIALAGCRTPKSSTASVDQQKPVTKIAFGSCSDQKRPQPLWDDIVAQKPDVWIWLGDNIYGDSESMDTLRTKYAQQKVKSGLSAVTAVDVHYWRLGRPRLWR